MTEEYQVFLCEHCETPAMDWSPLKCSLLDHIGSAALSIYRAFAIFSRSWLSNDTVGRCRLLARHHREMPLFSVVRANDRSKRELSSHHPCHCYDKQGLLPSRRFEHVERRMATRVCDLMIPAIDGMNRWIGVIHLFPGWLKWWLSSQLLVERSGGWGCWRIHG